MGRIPTFVIIIIGVVLVIGLSALMFFMVLKPEQQKLAEAVKQYEEEKAVADRLPQATAQLEQVTAEWLAKQAQLKELMRTRSIPISFAHPATAMIALWYEYREDLPPLIQRWIESTGCRIESSASFPAPPMTPPAPPPSGFMQIPEGQTITLTIAGDLASLERLYRSLNRFQRIVTVNQLIIQGEGDNLRAQVPFKFYLLAEVPAAAAAPAPSGGPPGGPPGGAPGGAPGVAPSEGGPSEEGGGGEEAPRPRGGGARGGGGEDMSE